MDRSLNYMEVVRYLKEICVYEVLVNAMHSGRSPYRWNFNIMDSHMRYVFQNTFISQDSAIDQNVLHLLKPR